MKVLKRLLCGALIAALLLPAAMAAPSENFFPDTQGHWAEEEINDAVLNRWVNGYPDGTFRPNETVTRAEFTKMLLSAIKVLPDYPYTRWLVSKNKTNQGPLNDMANHWLTKQGFIDVALAAGIIVADDYNGHNFRPEKAIARYEIALMADRALGLVYPATHEENLDLAFTDKDSIQDWMLGYIKEATDLGILKGYPDGSFGPQKTATRAEAVAIISRVVREMYQGEDDPPLTLAFEYNTSATPHAVRIISYAYYRKIDGVVYIPARTLLQSWNLVCTDADSLGIFTDPVNWDPISQCISATVYAYNQSTFYAGCQGYNFNVPGMIDTTKETLGHFTTPTRMIGGEVMIPVYSETGDDNWGVMLENNTLSISLPEPLDFPYT